MTAAVLPCRAVIDQIRCSAPASYRAVLSDCAVCAALGFFACLGHSVCTRDAAQLRADVLGFPQGRRAVVAHIHASTPALEAL